MRPIHELLARIRWDAEFANSRFVIGYWDRVAGTWARGAHVEKAGERLALPSPFGEANLYYHILNSRLRQEVST
jgi:uncharacterized protein (UPF0248 family)